jgi:hypothetical protein
METIAWVFVGGIVGGGLAWLFCTPQEQQVNQCLHLMTSGDPDTIAEVAARVTARVTPTS